MRTFKRHAALWQFLIVLALALILRLIVIGTRSIQYDDAFSIFLSERSLAEIVRGTAADTMPPLYYFLLHFWLQVGRSLTWLRLLSVLLSLGSVTMLFLLVRRLLVILPASGRRCWLPFPPSSYTTPRICACMPCWPSAS